MQNQPEDQADDAVWDFISTGSLPPGEQVRDWVQRAYDLYQQDDDGEVSQGYAPLGRMPRELFGLCITGTDGQIYQAGDADHEFTIMSISKAFVFALVCEARGARRVRDAVGVNATGLPFNSLTAVERGSGGRTNPMVNAGAIATTSLAPGETPQQQWDFILQGLSAFAGRKLRINEEVYACASQTNHRNEATARLLHHFERIYTEPPIATDVYTRQCSLDVTARDLAVMGATLADGGVNPLTKQRVVSPAVCHYTLAVMATAGLYESSGDWLFDVGLPGKSGIGGGIVTVAPGKGGLGTFAPPLDPAGNSVRGKLATKWLSHRLGLDLFVSKPYE